MTDAAESTSKELTDKFEKTLLDALHEARDTDKLGWNEIRAVIEVFNMRTNLVQINEYGDDNRQV